MNKRDLKRWIVFLDNYKFIIFTCEDAKDCMEKYVNNPKCFIFCDPPFLLTSTFYSCMSSKKFRVLFWNTHATVRMQVYNLRGVAEIITCFYHLIKNTTLKSNLNVWFFYWRHKNNEHKNISVSSYWFRKKVNKRGIFLPPPLLFVISDILGFSKLRAAIMSFLRVFS